MNRLLIGAAAAAIAIGMAPALAQTAPPPAGTPGTPPAPGTARVHMMSDRVMTRDDVVKHVARLFARLDTNRDGFVTREEVNALHQRFEGAMGEAGGVRKRLADRGVSMGDRNAMFDRLDTNHDGTISRQEFMSAQPQTRERRVMIMREGRQGAAGERGKMRMHGMGMGGFGGRLFEMADTNRDGRVSLQEAQAAALAHFDRADLNHDGRITPEERRQAHQLMRQGRPS